MKENLKDPEITYSVQLKFKGSVKEFQGVLDSLEKLPAEGLMIGTWPQPEHPAGGMMIDTVPLPEGPEPGIYPVAKLLRNELLEKLLDGQPKFKLLKDIKGGIRNAHIHRGNEIILLDRERFQSLVGKVASELAGRFEVGEGFTETFNALKDMGPGRI